LIAAASEPAFSVRTATSLGGLDLGSALDDKLADGARSETSATNGQDEVLVELVDRGPSERPGGRRFGALVHAILASVDLNGGKQAIEASARVNGRSFGATGEEIEAAERSVSIAVAHPVMQRALASATRAEVRRETPVVLALADGTLIEGVVDLAFRDVTADFNGWTVVDFKTDREFSASSARYIAQVRAYMRSIHVATGLPTRGVLLVL
jgi:ATP-dependent exoDNAse (exonuclease V) beta subunit